MIGKKKAVAPSVLTSPYVGRLLRDQDPNDDGINAGRRAGQLALGGPHTLLVGGTGQGKGRRDLMANILMWGKHPVLCMSTSGDLVEGTIRKRAARGPAYLLDLCGEVLDSELQGIDVQRVVSDPCALVHTDDEAKKMADMLLTVSDSANAGSSSSDEGPWKKMASRPLAALLLAGGELPNAETGEVINGGGINWVLAALDNLEDTSGDLITPSWNNAVARAHGLLNSRHAAALRSVKNMDARQRDSVAISIRTALDPWALASVAGDEDSVPFRPAMLEDPAATLYLVAPMDGSAAGAAASVIEQSIQHWRQGVSRKMPTLGLFLDEVANCARLPKLPVHIAVLRKYRIRMVAAVQTVIQLERVWGEVGMKEMLRTFPSILIMPNTPDREVFELASWYAGEVERGTSSTDEYGNTTRSKDRIPLITDSELIPRHRGTGRLLIGGSQGVEVELPDISQTDLQD